MMGKRHLGIILVLAGALTASGCALFLVGAGVAGGYAISKDSVRNLFDLPQDQVFGESLDVLRAMGYVTLEDRQRGKIKGEVQDVNVTITVRPVTRRTVELKVKARNNLMMPRVDTAQDVYTKILERLE